MTTHPSDQSFAVHLDSLLSFAHELTTQMHGVSKPADQLHGLLNAPILPGAFNEAASLTATHAASVAQMHTLLADVQQALSFANDVTSTVADGYLGAYLTGNGTTTTEV